MASRYAPIGEYGVIGDLFTVALVGMDGSIDFLCLPHFDSPSVFASLVDAERGGRFQIAPLLESAAHKQLYLPDTNVLLTRFLDADGVAELSDFMPVKDAGQAHTLVRRAKTVRGEVRFQMRCEPRFDYARATHTVERRGDTEVLFVGRSGDGELVLRLRSSVPMRVENGVALAEFTLAADTSAWFVLEVVLPQEPSPSAQPDYESDAFKETVNFWRRWVARGTYGGRWREMVNRSALTLKLLTSRQHGSIVAAPTFGLPETIGDGRNWDYRYTWIRDSSFTLYGLMRLGYTQEAGAFMRCRKKPCPTSRAIWGPVGLTGEEGTFSMCSFWYVECLSRMGDLHKARFFFEKMLGYANHLGLYGEELGPQAQHLGNFPQAFTHLALISAAFDLDRRLSAAGHAG
jgi:GH15 family glucan-1,4-alpha-glucosidase